MYNFYNPPKPPKWLNNVEAATQKLWAITAGGVTTGSAIQTCGFIAGCVRLPAPLRAKAVRLRDDLITGRNSKRGRSKITDHEVIQLAAFRKGA